MKNIKTVYKKVIEVQVKNWFKELKYVIDEYGILLENIYNMNKTDLDSLTNNTEVY